MSRSGRHLLIAIAIAIAVAVPIVIVSCSLSRGKGSGLNVVLMSIDSLRPDHLHCYGYPRETSHAIDGLAAEGVRFRTAVSTTSWTLPAHAALLTGLPDSVHGCTDNGRVLANDRTTLATLFGNAGYETAGLASGPYLAPVFGFNQGFDHYVNCSSMSDAEWTGGVQSAESLIAWNNRSHSDVTNPRVLQGAKNFLDSVGDRPFFLFLHWWDVHYDYEAPSPYDSQFDPDYHGWVTGKNVIEDVRIKEHMPEADKKHLIALYDGEIAWTDHHVGLVLDELKRRGLWDKTIVVITADHGEEFFEHQGKGHQQSLYDEVIKVPLILRWPNGPANRVVSGQVRLIDVFQTLVELTGIAAPPASDYRFSRNLEPFTRTGAAPPELRAFSELHVFALEKDYSALRHVGPNDSWKAFESFEKTTGRSFFDLDHDPQEQVWGSDDPRATRAYRDLEMTREAFAWLGAKMRGASAGEIPESVKEALRAIGYLPDEKKSEEKAPEPPPEKPH